MASDDPKIPKFKVLVVGPGHVGKTAFVHRQLNGEFEKKDDPTVGCEIKSLQFETTKGPVVLDTWDCAGREENKQLGDGFYIMAKAAFLMFDLTSRLSYKAIPDFYKAVDRVAYDKIPIILIGNKAEARERQIKSKDVLFHRKKSLSYFEISTKTGYNFEKPFLAAIRALMNDPDLEIISPKRGNNLAPADASVSSEIDTDWPIHAAPETQPSTALTNDSNNPNALPSLFPSALLNSNTDMATKPMLSFSSLLSSSSLSPSPAPVFGSPAPNENHSAFQTQSADPSPFQLANPFSAVPTFKVVITGDGGVGKTSFRTRHTTGAFSEKYIATLGVEVNPITLTTTKGPVKLTLWDCAGQPKFRGLADGYYIGAQAAIVMFDVTSRITYDNVPRHCHEFTRVVGEAPIVICGAKCDSTFDRTVMPDDIVFPAQSDLPYFEISSKNNDSLVQPFLFLLQRLLNDPNLQITGSANPFLSIPSASTPAPQSVSTASVSGLFSMSSPFGHSSPLFSLSSQPAATTLSSSSPSPPPSTSAYAPTPSTATATATGGRVIVSTKRRFPNAAAPVEGAAVPASSAAAAAAAEEKIKEDAKVFVGFCEAIQRQFGVRYL